jgi:hypothetical protein
MRPGAKVWVCGLREAKPDREPQDTDAACLYIIEFEDGSSIEVSQKWLTQADA